MAVPSWRRSLSRRVRRGCVPARRLITGLDPIEQSERVAADASHVGVGLAGRRGRALPLRTLHKHCPQGEALEGRPLLAAFTFDPDGAGLVPAQQVARFDFLPGDALADNSMGLAVGSNFQLYYQARLGAVIDPANVSS